MVRVRLHVARGDIMSGGTKLNVEFFSENLENKLEEISNFPCTLIEAASGFGKTTAVRHFLDKKSKEGCRIFTYRFLPENSKETSWNELCEFLVQMSPDTFSVLKEIGMPSEDNIADIRRHLQEMKSSGVEVFLFLDDYQAWKCDYAVEIIDMLTNQQTKNCHVIIASHPFSADQRAKLVPTARLYHLIEDDLVFNPEDARNYYASAGIELSDSQLSEVMDLTGGWIIALYLQLDSFIKKGSFEYGGMNALMEKTVWNGLSEQEKNTYLQLSVLPSFTLTQAAGFSGNSKAIDEKKLREKHYFIQYSPQEGRYFLHTQLKKFLSFRFDLLSDEEKQEIYLTAGKLCWEAGDRTRAVHLLYLSRHWDELYALPSDVSDFTTVNGEYTVPMIIDLMEHTDKELMYKYPNVPIYMAFVLFTVGQNAEIVRFAPMLRENIEMSALEKEKKEELEGELELLLSFLKYNRIDAMSAHHRKAWGLLGHPSKMFNSFSSWTFGSPSVLYLYWRENGKLDEELEQMDDCMPWYYKLSKNHGAGAELVMHAEAELYRGNLDQAEIIAYRSMFMADSKKQASIAICGAFILARFALFKGKKELVEEALSNLEECCHRRIEDLTRYTFDLADGHIAMLCGDYDRIKPWLLEGRIDSSCLTILTQPYAFIIYERYLLEKKEYAKLLGVSHLANQLSAIFPNLLPTLYTAIYCAAAYEAMGSCKEAVFEMKKALGLALPDGMYLPFAENYERVKKILAKCEIEAGARDKIEQLADMLSGSLEAMSFAGPRLSDKEQQVLELIKQGLTNAEIAEKQMVSLSTVKKQVSSILLKYGLASREQLKTEA
jgi:LuxR family maltose regulon positive regulatory protein